MILILIAILAAIFTGAYALWLSSDRCESVVVFAGGLLLLMGGGFAAVAYAFAGWSWIASDYQAKLINREYGTSYTREEVFYASSVIETIREIDRKRIELNGDLMTGDQP